MMLHLRPDLVRRDRIADDPAPTGMPPGLFRALDFGRRTDHGAVGYPSFADAETGRRLLEAIVDAVVRRGRRPAGPRDRAGPPPLIRPPARRLHPLGLH